MQSLELLNEFLDPLQKSGISYFVTGSIAAIFYGEPRLTHDIDIVVHLKSGEVELFSKLFSLDQFYCPPDEVIQIESKRKPYGHFNLIHHESGFKADIYTDCNDPLHRWAFENRRQIEIDGKLKIWLAPPEYVIIRKLEFYREGGSDKHIQDIQNMLTQVESQLDLIFLKNEFTARALLDVIKKANLVIGSQ